jgi:hypothetical protein
LFERDSPLNNGAAWGPETSWIVDLAIDVAVTGLDVFGQIRRQVNGGVVKVGRVRAVAQNAESPTVPNSLDLSETPVFEDAVYDTLPWRGGTPGRGLNLLESRALRGQGRDDKQPYRCSELTAP